MLRRAVENVGQTCFDHHAGDVHLGEPLERIAKAVTPAAECAEEVFERLTLDGDAVGLAGDRDDRPDSRSRARDDGA